MIKHFHPPYHVCLNYGLHKQCLADKDPQFTLVSSFFQLPLHKFRLFFTMRPLNNIQLSSTHRLSFTGAALHTLTLLTVLVVFFVTAESLSCNNFTIAQILLKTLEPIRV